MKKKNVILVLLISLITANLIIADTPKTVSTFESISIYWSPNGGADSLQVFVKFREKGTKNWNKGLSMIYNPIGKTTKELADYRGSIVYLTPNRTYEIELALEGTPIKDTVLAKTWSENFPIGKTIKISNLDSQYNITESGTEDGYILVDGTGSTIDVKNGSDFCIDVKGNYIIIRGFTLIGAKKCGINLTNNHDVIIEKCDISNWGEEEENGFGFDYQSAVYSSNGPNVPCSLTRIIVQRCKIHDPRWDSNSWSEFHGDGYHPEGPQGISFYNSAGNHVIRYNTIWSDKDHMYNDIIGFGENSSYEGAPAYDSDIYGNYLANSWDDGIEAEGANRNVRVWGNYIEKVLIPIGNAATSIGPLYIWKNTSGETFGKYSAFIKMGYAKSIDIMTGHSYIFNNTILQPNGYKGIGKDSRVIRHSVIRNNILHVKKGKNSISTGSRNLNFSCDYDLCSGKYPSNQEEHGIEGTPIYIDGASFNYENMTANYFLKSESPGYDAGEIIPNFTDNYNGTAPDMGAFEAGDSLMEYGVNAYLGKGE